MPDAPDSESFGVVPEVPVVDASVDVEVDGDDPGVVDDPDEAPAVEEEFDEDDPEDDEPDPGVSAAATP